MNSTMKILTKPAQSGKTALIIKYMNEIFDGYCDACEIDGKPICILISKFSLVIWKNL